MGLFTLISCDVPPEVQKYLITLVLLLRNSMIGGNKEKKKTGAADVFF